MVSELKLEYWEKISHNSIKFFITREGIGSIIGNLIISGLITQSFSLDVDEVTSKIFTWDFAGTVALILIVVFLIVLFVNTFKTIFSNFEKIEKRLPN